MDEFDRVCLQQSTETKEQDVNNTNNGTEEAPTIDIAINNVVACFATRCHLDLRTIATEGSNVEYRRENGMLTMKLRKPYTTASMWSSGKVTCTGATSEDDARIASRRVARILENLGFKVKFSRYRVVNVLATCTVGFKIKIGNFSENHPRNASYEPEIHPGVTYRIKDPKATMKIFSTGSITITAPSVSNVQAAVEHIFPLVYPYRMEKTEQDLVQKSKSLKYAKSNKNYKKVHINRNPDFSEEDEDAMFDSEDSELYDTDESFD